MALVPAPAGYSGTPLPRKLGLADGMAAAFVALPESLAWLTSSAAFRILEQFRAWADLAGVSRRYDVVHAFTMERAELEAHLPAIEKAIARDGMVWVCWPKKAARVATDVNENVVRAAALSGDLVDVKVAAIDATWSGLKLMIRRERR